MKKIAHAAAVTVVCASALRVQAATVTYTLEVNQASNTWALYGEASAGDNAGIAAWGVSLNNVNLPVTIQAPFLLFQDQDDLEVHRMGFGSLETNNSNPISSAQDIIELPVYGFGQTAGTLTLPPSTNFLGNRNPNYAAKLLLATDVYIGVGPSFTAATGDDFANVYLNNSGTQEITATMAFNTSLVPEPAGAMMLLAGLPLMARRRRVRA